MIPLAKDTREAIGDFADKVQNRSLLFEKMVLAKSWGHEVKRFNDANRFNVLRACTSGRQLLEEDRDAASRKASSRNARDHVKEENRYKAKVAGALAGVTVDDASLAQRQAENSLHLLSLLERSYEGRSHTFVGRLGGRLLINMAGGVQENAGMALDRCFGLPFVPGSAVKGIARSAALWDIRRTSDSAEKGRKLRLALLAFGFVGNDISRRGDFTWAADGDESLVLEAARPNAGGGSFKGVLSFLPAYPTSVPVIIAEVLTPHPRADRAARGEGDPRPIFFPAVKEETEFGFAILATRTPEEVPIADVLDQSGIWLREAVATRGVGAKTGAGYGWFVIDPRAEERRRQQMEDIAEKARLKRERDEAHAAELAAEKARQDSMSPEEREREAVRNLDPQGFAEWAKSLASRNEVQQRAFLAELMTKPHKDTRKRWKRNKPEIWTVVETAAQSLGISLD